MSKNKRYKKKPCGYCGEVTGNNHGEHVLPDSFYPSTTPGVVQRRKIPACFACNAEFQKDETHFRTIVSIAGPTFNSSRLEKWNESLTSMKRPVHGFAEGVSLLECLVPSGVNPVSGKPGVKVFPHRDQRVCKIVRKVVRGLMHYRDNTVILPDDHLLVDDGVEVPAEYRDLLEEDFFVPEAFESRVFDFRQSERLMRETNGAINCIWLVKFFDVPFMVTVLNCSVNEWRQTSSPNH